MALPEDIVTVSTATWSDHKNQPHGPVQGIHIDNLSPDNGTFFNLGDSIEYVGSESTAVSAKGRLMRVRFFLQRVGSPTGNLTVELRPNVSEAPDFSTLLATTQTYPVSSIPTSGKNEVVFTFQIPFNMVAGAYFLLLKISAQGDASNYVKVYRRAASPFVLDGGTRNFGSSTWTQDAGNVPSHTLEYALNDFYAFAVDKTNNKLRAYRTTDVGATWTEQDSAAAPSINSTATLRSMYVQRRVDDTSRIWVLFSNAANSLDWVFLGVATAGGVWSQTGPSIGNLPALTLNTNVSGQAPFMGGVNAGGALGTTAKATVVYQGATEINMGNPWRRIKLGSYDGSSWTLTATDVVGSTNTPNATLPGTGINYDLRWAGMDPLGHTHIIYSKSDSSTLQYRKFKADGTFTTINTMNGAVASATANYPVGQPAFYYQAPDWFIAVPYVDNSSNTLKVARCNVTTTETSANWTITEAVAANAETSTSNPAVLATEDLQGNKLLLWRVTPTTKTLNFTHDGGSNTWATEVPWRSGQAVEGISAQPMEDGGGLMYLDTAPATDELRYDRL